MNIKNLCRAAALAIFLNGTASAGEWGDLGKSIAPLAAPIDDNCLSYNFINLAYINTGFGNPYLSNGNGFGVGASMLVTNNIFLSANYAYGSFDDAWCGCFDVGDIHRYRFGPGLRVPIARCVDFTFDGGAEYNSMRWDRKTERNFDSWGYFFGPGIRARAGRLEGFTALHYYGREGDFSQNYIDPRFRSGDYRAGYNGWRFVTGLVYHLNDRFGLLFGCEVERLDNFFLAGTRYHF